MPSKFSYRVKLFTNRGWIKTLYFSSNANARLWLRDWLTKESYASSIILTGVTITQTSSYKGQVVTYTSAYNSPEEFIVETEN